MADLLRETSEALRQATSVPANLLIKSLRDVRPTTPAADMSGPGIAVDGVFYPVRTLSADDTAVLHDFLQNGLSEQSRRLRFMEAMPTVPESAAAWLADRDGHSRVALAALDPDDPATLVGVVEYASTADGPPEVAVAVADAFQGRGIGSNLLAMLATMSLAAGQDQWQAEVLADNDGPIHLLETVGTVHLGDVTEGVRRIEVTLQPNKLFGVTQQR